MVLKEALYSVIIALLIAESTGSGWLIIRTISCILNTIMASIPKMNKQQRTVVLSMLILIALAIFAADMYLPSLPAMTQALNASRAAVKMTVSIYLLGLGVSPLLFGPLSDRFGRRSVLLGGLGLALLGSLICALATSIHVLIGGRFIQAMGVASGLTIGRAMASDVFEGPALSRVSSYLGMIFGVIPAIAPVVGGYIQHLFGWRACFEFLLLFIALVFAWVFFVLSETSATRNMHAIHPRIVAKTYGSMLRQKQFIVYPFYAALSFASLMVYLTISPFLFQEVLHFTPVQFGWLAVIISAGIISGSIINAWCVARLSGRRMILISSTVMFVASLIMLGVALFGVFNIYAVMAPMYILVLGMQLGFSNAISGGMQKIKIARGFAVALFTSIQMGGSALANSIASLLPVHNQIPLSVMLVVITGVMCMLTYGVIRHHLEVTSSAVSSDSA